VFEVIPDFLNALDKIFVSGIRIQTKPTGNLCNSQIFVETEMKDTAMRFFQLLVHESRESIKLLQLFINGM
jgi:hypothetical protein